MPPPLTSMARSTLLPLEDLTQLCRLLGVFGNPHGIPGGGGGRDRSSVSRGGSRGRYFGWVLGVWGSKRGGLGALS